MKLYDDYINDYLRKINDLKTNNTYSEYSIIENSNWSKLSKSCLVLENEMAVELGHPSKESLSLLMITSSNDKIQNDSITVLGKELNEIKSNPSAFAKMIVIETDEMNDDQDAYDKFQKLDQIRHKINLEGYMLRAAFQNSREWSRVSKKALADGFSFQVYGSELINAYKKLPYVKKVQIVFITENDNLIKTFKPMGEKTTQITQALNRIFDNIEFDCNACSFQVVCNEIDGLKELHKKNKKSISC